jgi:hypothetical protein
MADSSSDDEIRGKVKNPYLYDPEWAPHLASNCDVQVGVSLGSLYITVSVQDFSRK